MLKGRGMEDKKIRLLTKEELEKIDKKREDNMRRIEERAKRNPELEKEMMRLTDKIKEDVRRRYGRSKK